LWLAGPLLLLALGVVVLGSVNVTVVLASASVGLLAVLTGLVVLGPALVMHRVAGGAAAGRSTSEEPVARGNGVR
jgi:hypothetical protein